MIQINEDQQTAPESGHVFQERRSFHRRRVLKTAKLLFNNGYTTFGCRVKNLTDRGALIEMGETTGVPNKFEFEMDQISGIPASIVWRNSTQIGLKFGH